MKWFSFWQIKIAILILFLTFTLRTNAQKIRMGLQAVPSFAWMKATSSDLSSEGGKFGFTYGLISDFYFAENYAFSTGLDITYKGGYLRTAGTTENEKIEIQFLEIPLCLKMKTNQIGSFIYFGKAGMSPAIKLKGESNIIPVSLALVLGGGLEIPFSGKTSFITGVTFNNVFTDLIKDEPTAISNWLGLNIGVLF